MESQVAHTPGQIHEQESHILGHHTAAEAEEEHHHEQKSVLKKVKAKAKKIKNTLTKHGHGHNHDHIPDDHTVDEEDTVEEDIVEDPEIYVAPAIKSTGQVKNSGQCGINTGRSTATEIDPLNLEHSVNPGAGSHIREQEERKVHTVEEDIVENPEIHGAPANKSTGQVENSGQCGINTGRSTAMEVDPLNMGHSVNPGAGSHIREQEERKVHTVEEDIVEDPEIHGAPAIKSIGQVENSGQGGINTGRSTAMEVDPLNLGHSVSPGAGSHIREQEERKVHTVEEDIVEDPEIHGAPAIKITGQVENSGRCGINTGRSKAMEVDPLNLGHSVSPGAGSHIREQEERKVHTVEEDIVEDPEIYGAPAIKSTGQVENSGQCGINTERSTAMEVTPLNLRNSVSPGAGNHIRVQEERKVHPVVNLGLTSVLGEVPDSPQNTPVVYAAPEVHHSGNDISTRTFVPGQEEHPGQPKVNMQGQKVLEEDLAAPKDPPGAYTSSNYQGKVTDPTSRVGEEMGITSVLSSLDKMNVHDESIPKSGQQKNWPTGTEDFYTSVPTVSHDQFSPELTAPKPVTTEETSDRTTTQENPHDHTVDTNKQSNQGSYTEKISSATSVIADKAVSVKNVVASKLGYGEKDNTGGYEKHGGDKSPSQASATDYGKKIAATVTEKLTPVYKKVAGAGSTVMSKMPGTNTGSDNRNERDVGGQVKGVSVKDYFAEKLRPGEEDKALSEVISEALHRKKAEQEKNSTTSRPVTETISGALHKRKEEPDEATNKPLGTVTESEEVERRLSHTKHDSSTEKMGSIYADNSGKGVVFKITGAGDSSFPKGEETRGSQQSFNSSVASASEEAGNDNSSDTGERRLQESGN